MNAPRTAATPIRGAVVFLLLALAALAPRPAASQVSVFPTQDLSFGILRAGVADQVDPLDPARRGEIELLGTGHVVITFGLPTEMVSPTGQRLPLQFDKGDAEIEIKGSGKTQSFDPTKSKSVNIKKNEGGARIYLGGLAMPTATQPPGRYRATITLQVVAPGT